MCVCRQDPCAGGRRWIEVTGATVSCRGCSYRTHSAPHTPVLDRGRRKTQAEMEKTERERRDGEGRWRSQTV